MKIVNDIFRASGRFVVVFTIISRPFIVVFIRTHRIGVCVCTNVSKKKEPNRQHWIVGGIFLIHFFTTQKMEL